MSETKKTVRSVIVLMIILFGSKLLGLVREILIAAKYGSGDESDAFFLALTITALVTALLTQAINTTVIPALSKLGGKEKKPEKDKLASNLINIVCLISIIIAVVGWMTAPLIVKLVAYGFQGEQLQLAVALTRIGLLSVVFAGIAGVIRGYLQSHQMYTETAVSDLIVNVSYIVFLIFMSGMYGIKGLMVASVIGVALQILIQKIGLKKTRFKYKRSLNFKDSDTKKILYLIPPVLISVAINDINKIIDRSLASALVEGSISALSYAGRLNVIVLGIFITAITTVIFPILSKQTNHDNYTGLKKITTHGVNVVLLITIPATVVMAVMAYPIVKLVFERGAFDTTATQMTASALIFYSLGLTGLAIRLLLIKVFYSLQDTKTPMINALIAVICNVILNFSLIGYMQHNGLALANSISAIIITVLLWYSLRRKIGSIEIRGSIICGFKALFASCVMGGGVYAVYHLLNRTYYGSFITEFAVLIVSLIIGALIYLLVIYLLKIEEMNWLADIVKKKIQR